MCADVYFRGSMDEFEEKFLAPLRDSLKLTSQNAADSNTRAAGSEAYAYVAKEYKSYYDYASQDCSSGPALTEGTAQYFICNTLQYPSANGYDADAQVGQGGYESRLSWMVPTSLFDDKAKAKEFFAEPLMMFVTGHVLGGAVNEVAADATAVHPGMRSTAMELLIPAELEPDNPDMPNVRAVLNKYVPLPKSAPIFNHDARNLNVLKPLGDAHGLDWQDMYWGDNLARLRQIKKKYDPTGVFRCRDCVTADKEASSLLLI